MNLYDVIIIGGGPAGLNAAVVLGRCRRNVLLFDTGKQRNILSHGMHNFLTWDDILPMDFLSIAHEEIKKYGVVNARKNDKDYFEVKDRHGKIYHSKKLLVATGLVDRLPAIEGIKEFYGKSVFHCPYCEGWEIRDKQIGVYSKRSEGVDLAVSLKTWSFHIVLYTDGKYYLRKPQKELLQKHNIAVITTPIQKLLGEEGILQMVIFKNGKSQLCDAIFVVNGFDQHCELVEELGCNMSRKGVVLTNRLQGTNVCGLYVAGDASRDMHFVVVAAAEGAKAGVHINKELQKEELECVEKDPGNMPHGIYIRLIK